MKIRISVLAMVMVMAGCGSDAQPNQSSNESSPTTSTTTSTTTTTTTTSTTSTTTTTTTTTTLPPPVPNADPATLVAAMRTAVEEDRFFVIDEFDDSDPLRIATDELDCDNPNSRSLGTAVALTDAEIADSASVGFHLAFAPHPWQVAIVQFVDEPTATAVVDEIATAPIVCPDGSQDVPLQAPDASQAVDEAGNPRFITALLTDVTLPLQVAGHSAAGQLATEFVNARGDTVQYRGAFRRGPFVVYVTGHDSEVNFMRLVAAADEVLRSAS